MFTTVAALTGFIAAVAAAPHSIAARDNFSQGTYVSYNGDGSSGQGWPTSDKWIASFDTMWSNNLNLITNSCGAFNVPNTSATEAAQIKDAINTVATSSGVDARIILAAVMQESGGCVRVWTTNWGVNNPGLMQDHNGNHNCNSGSQTKAGTVLNPCPQANILGMIQDGVMGTTSDPAPGGAGGPGYKDLGADAKNAQKTYEAARQYNAGSLAGSDLGAPGATASYCSDIANRLMGVVFDKSPWVHGAAGTGPASGSTTSPGKAQDSPAPAAPAAPASGSCKTPYTVASGDSCWAIGNAHGLTTAQLQTLNPSLSCTNLQVGSTVCIA